MTLPWAIDQLTAIQNRNGSSDLDCQAANDGMTEQSGLADSDINNIIARYEKTGSLDLWNARANPVYGDFTQGQDYQQNLNTVIAAQSAFDDLPASLRKRFQNDPVQLMNFLADPKNKDEAIALGLVNKPAPAPAAAAPPAAPAAPAPTAPKA